MMIPITDVKYWPFIHKLAFKGALCYSFCAKKIFNWFSMAY